MRARKGGQAPYKYLEKDRLPSCNSLAAAIFEEMGVLQEANEYDPLLHSTRMEDEHDKYCEKGP